MLAFTQRVISLRNEHFLFRRRDFFQGRPIRGSEVKDIRWLNPDGSETNDEVWGQAFSQCLGMQLSGSGLLETDERGRRLTDDNLLLLMNAHYEDIAFTLPDADGHHAWDVLLDTFDARGSPNIPRYKAGQNYPVHGRTLVLLKQGNVS